MIILFYEISHGHRLRNGGKYYAKTTGARHSPLHLSYMADRIWQWDTETGHVGFLKNRHGVDTEVDMREFTLVKLAARDYGKQRL